MELSTPVWSFGINDITENANIVKEILLQNLEQEGLLTKPAAEIAEKYAIICSKPGWFGSLWKKLHISPDDKNKFRYDVIKAV